MAHVSQIGNGQLLVEVSSQGAEMQSVKTADGRSWLWDGDPQFWTGRSPILFPIVGKAPSDTVTVDGQPYPMAQHGFARRSAFELIEHTETLCRHRLSASETTSAVYPFAFELVVEHAVQGARLRVSAEVSNRDDRPLVFGIGFHPAFCWPLPGASGKPHVVDLLEGGEPPMRRVEGGLLTTETHLSPFKAGQLVLDHSLFDADAAIFPEGAGTGLIYRAQGGPQLRFGWENLPNLALWSKPSAPFLCIEPWHGTAPEIGASAELSERPYAVSLPDGQTQVFAFTVDFSAANP